MWHANITNDVKKILVRVAVRAALPGTAWAHNLHAPVFSYRQIVLTIMQSQNSESDRDPAIPVPGAQLIDAEGRHAHIASIHAAGAELTALVRADDDGGEVMLPADKLLVQEDGSYCVPFALRAHEAHTLRHVADAAGATDVAQADHIVMPVIHEELQVSKRTVDTGKGIRVHKTVSQREQLVDIPLMHDEVQVERVPIGQMIAADAVPTPHYEGDTWVVPVLEEVLVVEKRMRLVEEVRIRKHRHEQNANQSVILRSEQVSIEHFDERSDASDDTTDSGLSQ